MPNSTAAVALLGPIILLDVRDLATSEKLRATVPSNVSHLATTPAGDFLQKSLRSLWAAPSQVPGLAAGDADTFLYCFLLCRWHFEQWGSRSGLKKDLLHTRRSFIYTSRKNNSRIIYKTAFTNICRDSLSTVVRFQMRIPLIRIYKPKVLQSHWANTRWCFAVNE